MTKTLVTISAFACLVCVSLSGPAEAQGAPPGGAIQPGTEFPAAPMSHGGISLSAPTQVLPPPGAAPPEAAPAPPPAPKKRHKRHKTS